MKLDEVEEVQKVVNAVEFDEKELIKAVRERYGDDTADTVSNCLKNDKYKDVEISTDSCGDTEVEMKLLRDYEWGPHDWRECPFKCLSFSICIDKNEEGVTEKYIDGVYITDY